MSKEGKLFLGQVIWILLCIMFASIGKMGHAHWLVIAASVFWVLGAAGWPQIPNQRGGLPAPLVVIAAVVVAVMAIIFGFVYLSGVGTVAVTFLSVIVLLISQAIA